MRKSLLTTISLVVIVIITSVFALISSGEVALSFAGRSAQGGQKQERTLKKAPWRGGPIKIEKIKIRDSEVRGDKFVEDDDWLRTLVIRVKNTSQRIIKYIELNLDFPRPEDSPNEPISRDHLLYGQYPLLPGEVGPANPQPPLMPNESVDIPLTDFAGTMEFLKATNYRSTIKHLEIEIGMVIFEDDTKWSDGQLYRRDSNKSDGWIPLGKPKRKARNESDLSKFLFVQLSYNHSRLATPLHFMKTSRVTTPRVTQDDPGPCTDRFHCGEVWFAEDLACTSQGVSGCAVRRDYVLAG